MASNLLAMASNLPPLGRSLHAEDPRRGIDCNGFGFQVAFGPGHCGHSISLPPGRDPKLNALGLNALDLKNGSASIGCFVRRNVTTESSRLRSKKTRDLTRTTKTSLLGLQLPPEKMGLGWVPGGSNTTEPEGMGQKP